MVDHVMPPSVDLSISYPVTASPTTIGAFQPRPISELETALALRLVGGGSTVRAGKI